MKILILFASTEGQTARIARRVFHDLAALGHNPALVNARDFGDLDVAEFDAAIVAGSVHLGRYQQELCDIVAAHRAALTERPNLFLSVSLSAAGDDPEDWKGLADCVQRFTDETGWTPDRVEQVAGALRFSSYDFFRSWAMRWIEAKRDPGAPAGQDREYTDWDALAGVIGDWTQGIAGDN